MRVRVITSKECLRCHDYVKRLKKQNFKYEQYDADLPENQKQLDEWHISDLPVVQIINGNDKIIHQFPPGGVSVRFIQKILEELGGKNGI